MEFILTYRTNNTNNPVGYEVMTICGDSLYDALCYYFGDQEDIVSIVRVF